MLDEILCQLKGELLAVHFDCSVGVDQLFCSESSAVVYNSAGLLPPQHGCVSLDPSPGEWISLRNLPLTSQNVHPCSGNDEENPSVDSQGWQRACLI